MTCLEFRCQLDRYVDRELTTDELALANEHLQRCIICRDELASLQQLKESLALSRPVGEPRDEYWEGSRQRILARTTLSDDRGREVPDAFPVERSYTPLMRSVLSVAASVALLAAVLVLGSKHGNQAVVINGPSGQVIVAAELANALETPYGGPLTMGDQRRIGTVSILAGGPGMLGRFNFLPGLLRVY
jgi:anti-sigma factor RsiW